MKDTITSAATIYVASLLLGGVAFLGFAVRHANGLVALGYTAAALVACAGVTLAAAKTYATLEAEITR